MLSVSLNVAAVAAMLIGIFGPANLEEVDSLNSPTARPIPHGITEMRTPWQPFKRVAAKNSTIHSL